eukprot:6200626-Pleurochrysis_carterae.AAC.2
MRPPLIFTQSPHNLRPISTASWGLRDVLTEHGGCTCSLAHRALPLGRLGLFRRCGAAVYVCVDADAEVRALRRRAVLDRAALGLARGHKALARWRRRQRRRRRRHQRRERGGARRERGAKRRRGRVEAAAERGDRLRGGADGDGVLDGVGARVSRGGEAVGTRRRRRHRRGGRGGGGQMLR